MDDFHITDYSIWEGFEADGWPVTTILRGNVVVDNREFKASPGSGQFIPRKVDAAVTNRPVA
jgi:dihydropyrimidinase